MSRAWSPITVEGIEKRIQALKQQQDDIKQMNAKMEKERKELKEKEDQIIKCRVTLYKLSDPKSEIKYFANIQHKLSKPNKNLYNCSDCEGWDGVSKRCGCGRKYMWSMDEQTGELEPDRY
jgi:hypothetical protein